MIYLIRHETRYLYSEPVARCHNEARLAPFDTLSQRCLEARLSVVPTVSQMVERTDFFGNRVWHFSIEDPHDSLVVTSSSRVEVSPETRELDFAADLDWETVAQNLSQDVTPQAIDARQFLLDSPLVQTSDALAEYARPSFPPGRPVLDAVRELMARIHAEFVYDPEFTDVATPLGVVMEHRRGVCQDFAHLAIGCLRSLGLAARYTSGYIETEPAPGTPRLEGADASHAWFAVYVPTRGWVDFDPTNNRMPWDQHIAVASGRDYSDVSPLKGILYGGGEHELEVSVDVSRVSA